MMVGGFLRAPVHQFQQRSVPWTGKLRACHTPNLVNQFLAVGKMLRLFSHKTNANDRCDVMLRESTQFMNNLKRAEKELKTLYKTADVRGAGRRVALHN